VTQLVDRFGRLHRSLRISVTDRCNIRCQYCMPAGPVTFLPRRELLSYEEIEELIQILAALGLTRIRLTGGEPLVRKELPDLVRRLKLIAEVETIALTTNAMLLSEQIEGLSRAGLDQINISLDTLNEAIFQQLSRREGLDRVLEGIEAALRFGYRPKLNAVLIKGLNADDAVDLVRFAIERGLVMRFIEYMPLDSDRRWDGTQMVDGQELRAELENHFGAMRLIEREDTSRPSQDFEFVSGGRVGFINPVTDPFCQACDRLRLTADGKLRNCLFGVEGWDLRELLRSGRQADVEELVRDCLKNKFASHGIGEAAFSPPERAMYQIGG
jgi:GTP 3',8-cyclase